MKRVHLEAQLKEKRAARYEAHLAEKRAIRGATKCIHQESAKRNLVYQWLTRVTTGLALKGLGYPTPSKKDK